MNEIHIIPPVYPVNMPSKFKGDRKKQPEKKQHKQENNNHGDKKQSNESADLHIDEIV
ncbi:MAG: hypothetical protein KAH20_06780 [Methylococcales bacterium]|nr:hypothetical protein [Methylococcales bacterium]